MLHAFDLARGASNTHHVTLPEDNDEAITFALSKNALPLLLQVKARDAGALDNFVQRKTALMKSVLKDDARAIKLLSDAGANINLRTRAGDSALDIAVQENKLTALKQLLACDGIDITSTNKQRKNALQIAYEKNNVEAFVLIAGVADRNNKATKDLINQYLLKTIKAGDFHGVSCLVKIPNLNVNIKVAGHSLVDWAIKLKKVAILGLLFPFSKHLLDCQLSEFISNFKHFNTLAKYEAFYRSIDPFVYLESFSLCDPVTLEALKILSMAEKAAVRDKEKAQKDTKSESAMDDKKVSGANLHFEKKVKPHFKAQYEAMGLAKIEACIREKIVEAILEEATLFKDEAVVAFVAKAKDDLIAGDPSIMQESVKVFNQSTTAHAAWRCYNPFAKVTGDWPNLLTRPESDRPVFSTQASSFINGTLKSHQASDIIRERTAYYFLAVIDPNEGNADDRKDRLGNFIGQLAEIRNTHKADDPSCFPGQLTRIAAMGNFHSIAQQPSGIKELLATYFRSKVFQQFKEHIADQDETARQNLLESLTQLTQLTAREHIADPQRYSKERLALRHAFISSLGNELKIAEEIRKETSYPLDDEDLIYIQQHLVDITRGDIAMALSEYARRLGDRAASVEDIAALRLFTEDAPNHQALLTSLMKALYEHEPCYRVSLHRLQNVAAYFANKISQLFEKPDNAAQLLSDLVDSLEVSEAAKQNLNNQFSCIVESAGFSIKTSSVTNPFTQKLDILQGQLKQTANPLLVARLNKMLPQLQRKVELFSHFVPYLNKALSGHDNRDAVVELVELLVDHCVVNDQFSQQDFMQELAQTAQLEQAIYEPLIPQMMMQLPKDIKVASPYLICSL